MTATRTVTLLPRLFGAAALAAASLTPGASFAQAVAAPEQPGVEDDLGLKTVATVALAGYDALLADIDFVGELGGRPATADMLEGMLAFFTGGRGVEGLDKTRPLGVVLQTDGASFTPLVCLPIADLTPLLELAEQFQLEPILEEDGVYAIETETQVVYFTSDGEWTFFAQAPEALEAAPADAGSVLKQAIGPYDIAVKIDAPALPAQYRALAVAQLRQGMEEGLEQQDNETDEQYASRRELAEAQIDQLSDLIEGLDRFFLGWTIDETEKQTYIDVEFTGIEGSDLALAMTAYDDDSTSGVTGFHRPEAALTALTAAMTPPEQLERQAEQVEATLKVFRAQKDQALSAALEKEIDKNDPEVADLRKALSDAIDVLIDAYGDTLMAGRVELGGSLDLSGGQIDLLLAGYLADTSRIEDAVKTMANTLTEAAARDGKSVEEFVSFDWDAGEHAGVRLHNVTVSLPEEAGRVRQQLGETLQLTVGVGESYAYLAAGPDAEGSLKSAIDASANRADETIRPGVFQMSVGQILTFAEPFIDGPQAEIVSMLLGVMEDLPEGKDHIIATTEAIDRGARLRYLIEEGVLRAAGQAAAAAAAQQQAAGPQW